MILFILNGDFSPEKTPDVIPFHLIHM